MGDGLLQYCLERIVATNHEYVNGDKKYFEAIINNGGVLENEVEEDGHIEQRYWIQL